jgi:hypothetical protein
LCSWFYYSKCVLPFTPEYPKGAKDTFERIISYSETLGFSIKDQKIFCAYFELYNNESVKHLRNDFKKLKIPTTAMENSTYFNNFMTNLHDLYDNNNEVIKFVKMGLVYAQESMKPKEGAVLKRPSIIKYEKLILTRMDSIFSKACEKAVLIMYKVQLIYPLVETLERLIGLPEDLFNNLQRFALCDDKKSLFDAYLPLIYSITRIETIDIGDVKKISEVPLDQGSNNTLFLCLNPAVNLILYDEYFYMHAYFYSKLFAVDKTNEGEKLCRLDKLFSLDAFKIMPAKSQNDYIMRCVYDICVLSLFYTISC